MDERKLRVGTSRGARSEKERLWIEAMIQNGGNQTRAAVEAGYKPGRAAEQAGHRLSKDVVVAAMLKKRRAEALEIAKTKTGLTVEKTLREIARIAYFDARKLFKPDGSLAPIYELDDDTAAALANFEVDEIRVDGAVVGHTRKIKLADKISALDKAMKYLGLYDLDNVRRLQLLETRGKSTEPIMKYSPEEAYKLMLAA